MSEKIIDALSEMTLLDYLASMAMQGICSNPNTVCSHEDVAMYAYRQAGEMLKIKKSTMTEPLSKSIDLLGIKADTIFERVKDMEAINAELWEALELVVKTWDAPITDYSTRMYEVINKTVRPLINKAKEQKV